MKPGQIVFREHYTLASNVAGVHEQLVGALADGVKKGRVLENAFDYVLISSLTYDRYFDA